MGYLNPTSALRLVAIACLLHIQATAQGVRLTANGKPTKLKPVLPDDKDASPHPGPYMSIVTQPTWRAAKVNVTYNPSPELLGPGYFFSTPFGDADLGAHIHDNDGTLIFYYNDLVAGKEEEKPRSQDLAVCDFQGSIGDHLCLSTVTFEGDAKVLATHRVLDNTYRQVGMYRTIAGWSQPNPHEFNMLPGGEAFLQAVYKLSRADLRPWGGSEDGYYFDGCFQEVDTRTSKELFRWCHSDHYDLNHTMVLPDTPVNEGKTGHMAGRGDWDVPWDHDHLNSVDKNDEGDYLVSLRHLSQVVKVAGRDSASGLAPGTTIWRMNGDPDSQVPGDIAVDADARFSVEHCARFINRTATEEVISLFNNAWKGKNSATGRVSSGMLLTVNNATRSAHLLQLYPHPQNRLSPAQGSAQLLPNGNVVVGWGGMAYHSEFAANGTLLYHAKSSEGAGILNYRVPKHEWRAAPMWQPKLLVYARRCFTTPDLGRSPLVAYVSWNGATEVRRWRFHVSYNSMAGPWIPAGTFDKTSFETRAHLSQGLLGRLGAVPVFVSAEALDAAGNVLVTETTGAFVPRHTLDGSCGPLGCFKLPGYTYKDEDSRAGSCPRTIKPVVAALVGLVIGAEATWYLVRALWAALFVRSAVASLAGNGHAKVPSVGHWGAS